MCCLFPSQAHSFSHGATVNRTAISITRPRVTASQTRTSAADVPGVLPRGQQLISLPDLLTICATNQSFRRRFTLFSPSVRPSVRLWFISISISLESFSRVDVLSLKFSNHTLDSRKLFIYCSFHHFFSIVFNLIFFFFSIFLIFLFNLSFFSIFFNFLI